MRRRSAIAAVVLPVVVLAGCAAVEATGGPVRTPGPAPASVPPVPVPTSVQRIPGQPPIVHYGTVPGATPGVPYEYHLYVHCGIRAAEFAGRSWVALPRPDPLPPATEVSPDQYLTGVMTLIAPDRAVFEWAEGRAEFEPARAPQPQCA